MTDDPLKHKTVAALDASFDIFPDFLFLFSPDGIILDYRGGRRAALSTPPDAFLQRSIHAVLPPPVAAQFAEAIARVRDTESPVAIDYVLPKSDGEHAFEARLVRLVPDAILAICRDVTETVRTNERLGTERRLEEARRTEMLSLLRSTLDSTADGILVVDRHGRIATSNQQFATMWRIPSAIAASQDDDLALAFVLDQLVDPEAFLAKVRELYASPDTESFDVLDFKDGRTFERYSQPQYLDGAIVGRVWSFRDVTDRMRAEAALRESEARFRQLTESIDQVFWLRDVGVERILYVSPAFESILGRSVDELYANPWLWIESIDPADRPGVLERYVAWQNGETTEPASLTYRIVRPDGTIRWILDTVTPIRNPQGRVYRVGGVAKDITARRDTDDARRHLEAQRQHAQRMEAMGTLASGIAHDFSNALSVIIGNTQVAQRLAPADPAVRDCLDAVLTASARAHALIRQMLTFARAPAGERRAVSLGPIVQEATRLLQATLPTTVQIALTIDPDAPIVLADPTQILQVVINLVSNAAQAVAGHATVEIAVGQLDVSSERVQFEPDLAVGSYAMISVTDRGSGMDDTTRRRVFEPFFTTKAPGEGTGLGLSVVHGIVTGHGGRIRVQSEPGVGSRFEVYFPASAVVVSVPEPSLDEWRTMLTMRPNVLIEGPEAATEALLRALRPHCREPLGYWGDTLGDQRPPTLIVREVAALSATDQQRLLRSLERGERSQVLTTTAQPLFSLVERGEFLADLYYRLNVLRLDAQKGVRLQEP
jgi:PAS domain S-box-containing protein